MIGGSSNSGTVYKLTGSGQSWTETVLYSFPSGDGFPLGELLLDKEGNLYGVTESSVFRLTPPAGGQGSWTETTLYTFNAAGDGRGPTGGLIGDSSGIYGTTRAGGAGGKGIVFELTPPGSGEGTWNETVLYSFSGAAGDGPNGNLLAKGGNLFGTTAYGGTNNMGTVFKIKPPRSGEGAWRESVLYNFSGPDGRLPYSGLASAEDGTFYGSTVEGGVFGKSGYGTVFQLSPPAKGERTWSEAVLHSFDDKDGTSPGLLVIDKSGAIYGNAQYSAGQNTGLSFRILP